MKRILCGWLIAVCGVLLASTAWAAVPFIEVPADGWDPGPEARKRYTGGMYDWARRVTVDRTALASDRIQVDLFDDVLIVERSPLVAKEPENVPLYVAAGSTHDAQRSPTSRQLWAGTIIGARGPGGMPSTVDISELGNGDLISSFSRGHVLYQLFGDLLVRIDLRRVPNEAPSVRDPYPADPLILDKVSPSIAASTIRVAFGYGNGALADGREQVFRMMERAVAHANAGFLASGILIELQRAGNALPGYAESSVVQTLDDLVLGTNGPLWLVHRMRHLEKADLMLMIIDTKDPGSICGQAQRLLATKETAFAVVERRCLANEINSLAHEIGHLLGADHDPAHASIRPPKFEYGHGYQSPPSTSDRWRTVMAYDCSDRACARVNRWSSPRVSHNGLPAGTSRLHDNVRVLNETRTTVAAFYPDP
ncbi:M12 family metallo-peptidase [Stenotrophomonas rhizophila]